MSLKSLFILLPLVSVGTSCALFQSDPKEPRSVLSSTIVPKEFNQQHELSDAESIVLPDNILTLVRTTRKQVELREGPGLAFQLKDDILPKDRTLIVLETTKKWLKVLDPSHNLVGWIHMQTARPIEAQGHKETVTLGALPKTFTVTTIKEIYSYEDGKAIEVAIPKGTYFIRLRDVKDRSLVIIPHTGSLAWFNKKDIL